MTPVEVNVFLTQAAHLDPRMKRNDPEDQAAMAELWAEALPDVSLADALAVIPVHYRESRDPMMPADVAKLCAGPSVRELSSRDAWLVGQGIDPEDYDRLRARGVPASEVLARFDVAVAELES